jgi:ABC-type branched-subunit amino acid transport system substrate-binding protein
MKDLVSRALLLVTIPLACACGAGAKQEAPGALAAREPRAAGCSQEKRVVRLGALVDASGPTTTPLYGAAITLAANQMNEALRRGDCPDTEFEIVFGDDHGNTPATARTEALRLVNDAGVLGLVGDSSGDTVAANQLNYDPASPAARKVPITCYQCSSGFIHDPAVVEADPLTQAAERDTGNWLFRVFYNANFEAKVLDQIIVTRPNHGDRTGDGNLKISVYADPGHKSLATAIGPALTSYYAGKSSVEIVLLSSLANLATEWARVVDQRNETTGLTDGEPDVVVLAMLPINVVPAVHAYRSAGVQLPLLSNHSFRRNFILSKAGTDPEGLEGISVALVDKGPSGQAFVHAFTAATGQGPEQTTSGAYDATMTLILATLVAATEVGGIAKVTSADVRAALARVHDPAGEVIRPTVEDLERAVRLVKQRHPIRYEGAYDPGNWDAVGDMFPRLVHWAVQGGKFVEFESFQCDPAHPSCPVAR